MRRPFVLLVSLLLLAACDEGAMLPELQSAPIPTDPYQAALTHAYLTFAQTEYTDADWDTSDYLAEKGLAASQGKSVLPESPTTWDVTDPAFTSSRTTLLQAIPANKTTQPTLTANAVVSYDHWLLAKHNETDAGRVETWHQQFLSALDALQSAHTAQPGIATPSSEPVAPPTSGKPAHAPTILYFPFDRDTLGSSASSAIQQLAQQILAVPNAAVSINGHTDRAGTEAYNLGLSERRARFVLHALETDGVPNGRMHYFAFGESDPAVPTADGVREPRNRRVEIFVE